MKCLFPDAQPGTSEDPPAGKWVPYEGKALFGCPECGALNLLKNYHAVDETGGVNPRFRCVGCGLHDSIVLAGWTTLGGHVDTKFDMLATAPAPLDEVGPDRRR